MLMVHDGLCKSLLDVQYYEDELNICTSILEKSYSIFSMVSNFLGFIALKPP